jgi:hypothetical protein
METKSYIFFATKMQIADKGSSQDESWVQI